jgi:hypothetical protein
VSPRTPPGQLFSSGGKTAPSRFNQALAAVFKGNV